jgi:phosphotransferase system IIB component
MNEPFIITIEHCDTKVSIQRNHSDVDSNELKEMLITLCVAAGYHPSTVNQMFNIEEK